MNARSIFITGGANGIGRSTSRLFALKGWQVAIFDIDEHQLLSLTSVLKDTSVHTYTGDVTSPRDLERALTDFMGKTQGSLDVLFNNAGILRAGEFEIIPLKEQFSVLDVNIKGIMNATSAALPYLKKSSKGHIINMSSASAFFGNPELTAYAASKAAVNSLTEGWSVAFEKYNIRVSDLQPIYVKTALVTDNMDNIGGLQPNDIKLTPELVAGYVWKAVHRNRLHWPIGLDTKFFRFIMRFLPDGVKRFMLKKIIGYG